MPGLNDRWASRDYPVLEWIVAQFDAEDARTISHETVAEALQISTEAANQAIDNLERGGYIGNITRMFGRGFIVTNITERALRETGLWPNEEAIADQLLWFLEQKVTSATSTDERSKWARIRDGIVAGGRDFAVELGAAMATRSLGG